MAPRARSCQWSIPETLILVLGIAVAAALIKLGEQFLMGGEEGRAAT